MARIAIDLDRTIGAIDRRIFGGFVEHLGRCIYGGIFEPGSPLSDEHGFRRDVLDAARQLRMPILRWPGGNFVSGYHWTDGVGPVEKRSKRLELAWRTVEPNTFGTHEFIEYCHALDLEPYICLNMGTGTLDEACAWVEYCNGVADTYWANLRRANGHPEPYNVRYWGLGNEMYGPWQIGHLTADEYVLTAQRWADALRRTDSTIELVGCGQDGWSDWDRIVVDGLARYVNYHSIHIYTGSDDYWSNVLAPHQAERGLEICQALINRARYLQNVNSEIGIAYDEWNVWFRERGEQSGLEERYTLADALAVATYLNIFVRHCRSVRIADLAQLVNVIAPIFTSKTGLFLQTIYHPLSLYAEHTQQVAVDPVVVCETVTHRDPPDAPWAHRVGDLGPFKLLDVAATRDETGRRLTLTVVNRSPDLAVSATVELNRPVEAGNARVHLVHGPSPNASNSFADPNSVGVRTQSLQIEGNRFELVFPQHSISCVELPVAVETTSAMRLVDPHIELVACGSSLRSMPTFPEWDATILDLAYEQVAISRCTATTTPTVVIQPVTWHARETWTPSSTKQWPHVITSRRGSAAASGCTCPLTSSTSRIATSSVRQGRLRGHRCPAWARTSSPHWMLSSSAACSSRCCGMPIG